MLWTGCLSAFKIAGGEHRSFSQKLGNAPDAVAQVTWTRQYCRTTEVASAFSDED